MSQWNAMTYEGKDTILRVVRTEAERLFALAEAPRAWDAPTACQGWSTRDVVAHIVDTTEGYLRAFDAARGAGEVPPPHGLAMMSQKVGEGARALRPAFFYAAGQFMDYGVHSWDVRQGSGRAHGLPGDAADLLVPFMFAIWQGTVRTDAVADPFTIGIRVTGRNAGDYRVSLGAEGLSYEPGEIEGLPASIEFDPGSPVLTAFGRSSSGTVRGDLELAERYLNLFFPV